jgi:excisionase family DNA binding protein
MNQTIKSEKLTLSIPEAAKRIGISDTSMRQLARTAGFPAFQVGCRLLVSAKGLEAWVEEQARKGANKGA